MRYDIIIAGASFAGLAVAAQLQGKRVLLLDRKPIGTGQTSACGTLVCTLRALGLEDAILQVHDRLVVHTPGRTFVYPMAEPFCTFDYALLCRLLQEQGDADFALAAVVRLEGDRVRTSRSTFRGDVIVDASGWRAVLGSHLRRDLVRRDRLNFGLETTVAYRDDGLHFWYDPRGLLPMGVTWAFPIGELSRIGIGSYRGDTRLGPGLDRFLADLPVPADGPGDLRRDGLHGGYFPHTLRDPLVGDVFLVGDAAGQCLGLTGEGIRPALFFGIHLGRLLRQVLDGEMTLEEGRHAYRRLVAARKPGYDLLCLAQRVVPRLPLPMVQGLMAFVNRPVVLRLILGLYVWAFSEMANDRQELRQQHRRTKLPGSHTPGDVARSQCGSTDGEGLSTKESRMKKSLGTSIYLAVVVIVVGLALMLAEALTGATIETPGDVLAAVGRTLTFLQFGVPRTLPGLLGNLMVLGGALFLVVRRRQERSA